MAYMVSRPGGSWELRESRLTKRGPRSRTLASFRRLGPDGVARALERSSAPITADEVRALARRAGAPVTAAVVDEAATTLLRELARGAQPQPRLRRPLAEALVGENALSDSERAAAAWIGASPERRGRALWDLLLLADRIPARRRPAATRFGRLDSSVR